MSHNIEYFTYFDPCDKKKVQANLDAYIAGATYRETGGRGMDKPIRWLDPILDSQDAAEQFLKDNDRGWYDNLAVRFRETAIQKAPASKKLEELRRRYKEADEKYESASSIVAARSFKAQMVGCRHCGSKINREYIRTNNCPVCGRDMRPESTLADIKRLKEKRGTVLKELREEEQKIAKKAAKPTGKVSWLVKIEYHT